MIYNESVLTETERRIFALRSLYSKAGYESYRMRKFEDYDLYSRNKDFLLSDRVLTFTDTNGRLKALKPDVTLSIVRNISAVPGERIRLYYDENVYRSSEKTGGFREIMQMGLECIGDADNSSAAEVMCLAEQSLALLAGDSEYVLRISDIDILTLLTDAMSDSRSVRNELLKLAGSKNLHGIERVCAENGIPDEKRGTLTAVLGLYGSPEAVMPELEKLCRGTEAEAEVGELGDVLGRLREEGPDMDRIVLDLSIVGDTSYYNGMTFEGFIEGIPDCVLVGGRYDNLMHKMKKRSRAIGFAVYLDALAMLGRTSEDRSMINVALPKGRLGEKVYKLFEEAGYGCSDIFEGRKLVFENREAGVRYFWVKPSDVPIYVERGAADVGICGKDILLEYQPNVYELKDLGMGRCRMMVAAKEGFRDDSEYPLRVATKFVNIAQDYYSSVGRDIDIIHLNGSIEIAPLLGLSDVIVDIVETGRTLKENDLRIYEEIMDISTRLIANRSAYNFKSEAVNDMLERLQKAAEQQ